jgi:hypothetical protein
MSECHSAAGFVRLFPSEDIPSILQNIQTSCETLIRQKPSEIENDLTKRLYLQLCRFPEYRTGPIEPHWESHVVVFDEDEPGITGRVDIRFSCGRGIETYFPVEAKRLFVTYPKGGKASLVADYIDDGMLRFVTGQYGYKMSAGAMLGYVCDNTVSKAKNTLFAAIDKEAAKLRLTANGRWQESIIGVTPPVDETRHELDSCGFTIYHILTKV